MPIRVEISGGSPPNPEIVRRIVLDEAAGGLTNVVQEVEKQWKRIAPVRTGHYRRSITHRGGRIIGNSASAMVGTRLNYALWLEKGTGLYGPRHQLIRPKTKKALRFPDPGQGSGAGSPFTLAGRQRSGRAGRDARWVFAKSVKGIHPRHYAERAVKLAELWTRMHMRRAGARAAQRIERAFR